MSNLKEKIIEELKEVYDPEIPINIYDLGLIYKIDIDDKNNVKITMTLTSPTCPTADYIREMVEESVRKISEVKSVETLLTFEPRWSPSMVSDYAKEELGLTESSIPETPINNLFNSNGSEDSREVNLCFNCGLEDSKRPLLKATYKGERVFVCNTCLNKL